MANFPKPKSLVDQIYLSLSEAISKGTLAPGCVLVEQELEKSFGVSRSPIREAIRLLEADGLVEVTAYKKKCVRRLTRSDLTDNIPVLASLESLAAKLAAFNMTPEKITKLQEFNEQIKNSFAAKDYMQCAQFNFRFHRTFLQVADNKVLKRSIKAIVKSTVWLWLTTQYYQDHSIIPSSIQEHHAIIEAFKNQDAQLVEVEVRDHIEKVLERFLNQSIFGCDGSYQYLLPDEIEPKST